MTREHALALALWLLLGFGFSGSGCGDSPPADGDADGDGDGDAGGPVHVDEAPGCDPLVGAICAFPFPSMHYLEEDPGSPTGYRVALTEAVLPGHHGDPETYLEHFNAADGFSIATPWLTVFPEAALDPSTLPSLDDLGESLDPGAAVQVLDRDTGERYPVWAELDWNTDDPEEQTLIIRPMRGLALGRRVAIVVTDGLSNADGSTPEPPPAFRALRDGLETDSDLIEGRREGFEELFAFLAEHDLPRERLLLAWEGVTFSDDFALSQIGPLLEAALAEVEARPPAYRIDRCFSHDEADRAALGCEAQVDEDLPLSPLTWRRIFGTVELPSFLDGEGYVRLDESGAPVVQGTFEVDFVVNIPASLREAAAGSAPVLVFGHGLLRDPYRYLSADVDIDGQMALADQMGAVFVGTRWSGLSLADLTEATNLIFEPSTSFVFTSRLRQGIVDQLLMPVLAAGPLAEDPLLQAADGSGTLIDGENFFYTGISLGGIFGTTFMAFSPHVRTGVLHVPGSGFTHMMAHSADFNLFQVLLNGEIGDRREQQIFFALAQRYFDVGDPINYLSHLTEDPLTALGPKSCLWQCAIGDSEAMWYGCDMLVRTGGFPVVAPPVVEVFGTETIETPTAPGTSGMAQFDPGLGMPSLVGEGGATGAHTAIRRNPEVQLQTLDYFDLDDPGRIHNHCDGACTIDPVPEPEE